jgi:hypothetical protein
MGWSGGRLRGFLEVSKVDLEAGVAALKVIFAPTVVLLGVEGGGLEDPCGDNAIASLTAASLNFLIDELGSE